MIVFQLSLFFQFTYESLLNYVLAADMEFGLFRFLMWTLSWPKGKAHFRYEITPKTRVHEKEKFSRPEVLGLMGGTRHTDGSGGGDVSGLRIAYLY